MIAEAYRLVLGLLPAILAGLVAFLALGEGTRRLARLQREFTVENIAITVACVTVGLSLIPLALDATTPNTHIKGGEVLTLLLMMAAVVVAAVSVYLQRWSHAAVITAAAVIIFTLNCALNADYYQVLIAQARQVNPNGVTAAYQLYGGEAADWSQTTMVFDFFALLGAIVILIVIGREFYHWTMDTRAREEEARELAAQQREDELGAVRAAAYAEGELAGRHAGQEAVIDAYDRGHAAGFTNGVTAGRASGEEAGFTAGWYACCRAHNIQPDAPQRDGYPPEEPDEPGVDPNPNPNQPQPGADQAPQTDPIG